MRICIIRHGDPDYEQDNLTEQGHREAAALAEHLATEGLDRIYTSPLGRAQATMRYTAERLGQEPDATLDWTREIPGIRLQTQPWSDLAAWNIPGEHLRGGQPYPTQTNWMDADYLANVPVEPMFESLIADSDAFLSNLGYVREGGRYRVVSENREKIAVFCHHGFGLAWLAHLLQLPLTLVWGGFWLPPSSVTTVLFEQRSTEWAVPRCIGLGDVSHLRRSGVPVSTSGLLGEHASAHSQL